MMREEESVSFEAVVSGELYRLKIRPSQVEAAQELIDNLNKRINHFRDTYKNRKLNDWLTMTLLEYAFEVQDLKSGLVSDDVLTKLNTLDERMTELVK